jgi:hypothetical protein
MAIFRTSPEKNLHRDRDAAHANRDRLAIRLSDAEQAVIATKSAGQRAALDADDGALDAAEHAEAAALRRVSTIAAAHAEAEQVLVRLDGQIAAALDVKTRTTTASKTVALADELVQVAAGFDTAVAALADTSSRASLIVFEATGVANFATSARVEVPAAVEVVSALLREHAKMVLSRLAPATLPAPTNPFVPTIPPKPDVNATSPDGLPSQFQSVNRGPAYQFKVAGAAS